MAVFLLNSLGDSYFKTVIQNVLTVPCEESLTFLRQSP